MIRDHFPKMARASGDSELMQLVDRRTAAGVEFTELLVDELGVTDVGAFYPHTVTLASFVPLAALAALGDKPDGCWKQVRGLQLIELPEADQCCGFGGTFAIKNADVSAAMLSDKMRAVLDTGAEVCTATDNSCLMHIGGALEPQRTGVRAYTWLKFWRPNA